MCAMISSQSCHGGKDLHSEYLPCRSDIAGVGKWSSTHERRSSLRTPTILIPPQLPIVTVCYDLASRWWHCIPCNSFVKELCKRQLWYVFLSFLCHHYGIPPHTHTRQETSLHNIDELSAPTTSSCRGTWFPNYYRSSKSVGRRASMTTCICTS